MPQTPFPIRTGTPLREVYSSLLDTPELSSASTLNSSPLLSSPDRSWNLENVRLHDDKSLFLQTPRRPRDTRDLDELLRELEVAEYRHAQTKELQVLEVIGKGGIAIVHRALFNGHQVAAKIASTSHAKACLRREIEILDHICSYCNDLDNIVEHYTLETIGDTEALILELADRDLMDVNLIGFRSQDRRAPLSSVARWNALARQMHAALMAIHKVGVVHGDIKPQNYLLTHDDVVKLTDFECAYTPCGPLLQMPVTHCDVVGTTAYSAPELLHIRPMPATYESDIYALGVSLLVLATGEEPYSCARNGIEQILQARSGDPIRFSDRTQLTAPVENVVRGCCAKDPADRWTHAQIREALGSC